MSYERMNKQKAPRSPLTQQTEGGNTREDHYYVQVLTGSIFLVRKYQSAQGKPGPDDSIVRSFNVSHDAYSYANSLNEEVKKTGRSEA